MTSADLPPSNQPSDELPTSPSGRQPLKWELTHDSLERLLKAFSPDAEEGPKLLLLMQKKLTRSFEGRGCYSPDDLIDEVINRVARRLEEGEIIYNLNGYFLEVGHRVHQEWLRRRTNKCGDAISFRRPLLASERVTLQQRKDDLEKQSSEQRIEVEQLRAELQRTLGQQG